MRREVSVPVGRSQNSNEGGYHKRIQMGVKREEYQSQKISQPCFEHKMIYSVAFQLTLFPNEQ